MSAVNTMPNSQTPPQLPELREPKFTAAQIEKDCPARLQEIGREIVKRLEKAEKQAQLARDHVIAVDQLLAEAKELCDDGGFRKFRELFFPQLGKSQAYALLGIAAGKKTLAEHRTAERERKQKSRANQRAAAANSGTVPEKSGMQDAPTEDGVVEHPSTAAEQTPEPSKLWTARASAAAADSGTDPEKSGMQDAPTEDGVVEHPSTAAEQTPEPSKLWTARASAEGMRVFTVQTIELQKRIDKRPPEHFSETVVSVEILEQLGHLFTGLAKLIRAKAAKPAPVMPRPGDVTNSDRQTAVNAEHAAPEAGIDGVALHEHV